MLYLEFTGGRTFSVKRRFGRREALVVQKIGQVPIGRIGEIAFGRIAVQTPAQGAGVAVFPKQIQLQPNGAGLDINQHRFIQAKLTGRVV